MIARSTSVDRWVRISYTQQVNVNVNNPAPQAQRGVWKFTYTYNVTPTTPTVDPATCWTCSANSSGVVDVNFTGFTASESFLKNNNAGTQKYSFTLLDSLLQSRVLGVTAQLQKQNPDLSWSDIGSPIVFASPLPVTASTTKYPYYANAGVFGNSAVYSFLDAPTPGNNLGGRLINTILTTLPMDNFAGNNNDLVTGNVQEADFSGSFTGITDSGSYRIVVSGSVKENSGTGVEPFSVNSTVVNINGCTSDTLPQPACTP
jgi:hypothetical protein